MLAAVNLRRSRIDASLVRDLDEGGNSETLVRAIIAIAHPMRVQVAADGVASAVEIERLRQRGCDEIQGPFVAPALPADGFERFRSAEKQEEAPAFGPTA